MKSWVNSRHPLCGWNLEKPLEFLSFYDVFAGCVAIGIILPYRMYCHFSNSCKELPRSENLHYFEVFLWVFHAGSSVYAFLLAAVMWKAVKSKNVTLMKVYVILNFNMCFLGVTIILTQLIFFFKTIHITSFVSILVYICVKLYYCCVVHFYIKELTHERDVKAEARCLTQIEISDFENGRENAENRAEDFTQNIPQLAMLNGYQKHFEIAMSQLSIGWDNPLGKGEFGSVYKAFLDDNDYATAVAVKVIHSESTDASSFKLILSELKVMTYVGEHPNVVRLIGANTTEIKERKLFIIMEFCAFGSLSDVLRGSKGSFINLVESGRLLTRSREMRPQEYETICTLDLLRWSQQIATGMEFLASKRLVHGDLAARNILLTDQRIAKITDFGLSRQLYEYAVYVKKSSQRVPWMHLAVESIVDHSFSVQSDVWSFGVTLWEMFTLGEVPYSEHSFGHQFLRDLKNGMRLPCPPCSPCFLYELMQVCWNSNPEERPTFPKIQQLLQPYA